MHKAVMNKINWIYLSWNLNKEKHKPKKKKKIHLLEYIKKKWALMEMLLVAQDYISIKISV